MASTKLLIFSNFLKYLPQMIRIAMILTLIYGIVILSYAVAHQILWYSNLAEFKDFRFSSVLF